LFVVSRIAVAFCRSFSRDLCCILHMINHYAANNDYSPYMVA